MSEKNENSIKTYEEIYSLLKKYFETYYGTEEKRGVLSVNTFVKLMYSGSKEDYEHKLPENILLRELKEERIGYQELFKILKDTYLSDEREKDNLKGPIGCLEDAESQLKGITNMTLLMYLSNQLAKKYEEAANKDPEMREKYTRNKKKLYKTKSNLLTNIVSSIYVLEKTSDEYKDYFCYGFRQDNNNDPSFVIDLPYTGQICVHVGTEKQKEELLEEIEENINSIVVKKLELNQITEEQCEKILKDLKYEKFNPNYNGKLYEYMALPIKYKGKVSKGFEKIILDKIGKKSIKEATEEDIEIIRKKVVGHGGLNEREIYYILIKMGAPKIVLERLVSEFKKEQEEQENERRKNYKDNNKKIIEQMKSIKEKNAKEEKAIKPQDKNKEKKKKENKKNSRDYASENEEFLAEINTNIGEIITPEIMEGLLKRASYSFKDVYENKLRQRILKELKVLGVTKETRDIEAQKVFIYIRMVKNLSTVNAGMTNGKMLTELVEDSVIEYGEGFDFLEKHMSDGLTYNELRKQLKNYIEKRPNPYEQTKQYEPENLDKIEEVTIPIQESDEKANLPEDKKDQNKKDMQKANINSEPKTVQEFASKYAKLIADLARVDEESAKLDRELAELRKEYYIREKNVKIAEEMVKEARMARDSAAEKLKKMKEKQNALNKEMEELEGRKKQIDRMLGGDTDE